MIAMRPALTLPALNRLVGLMTAVGVIGVAAVAQGQPHPYNPYWADGFNPGTYQPRDAFSEKWLQAPDFREEALEEAYEPNDVPDVNVPAMRAPDPSPWELSDDRPLPPGSPLSSEPARAPRDPYWVDDYWRDDYWADHYWGDDYFGNDYWVDDYWVNDYWLNDSWVDDYWVEDEWVNDYWVDDYPPTAEMTDDYFSDE